MAAAILCGLRRYRAHRQKVMAGIYESGDNVAPRKNNPLYAQLEDWHSTRCSQV